MNNKQKIRANNIKNLFLIGMWVMLLSMSLIMFSFKIKPFDDFNFISFCIGAGCVFVIYDLMDLKL